MKFFKHFADAGRSRLIQHLMREMGLAGVGGWWTIVQHCAEKLEKKRDEEFTEAHCVFTFDERVLRDSLRLSSTRVERLLNHCSTTGSLSWTKVGYEIRIEMPNLLKFMDRDSSRTRPRRGHGAARTGQDKDKDKDKESPYPQPGERTFTEEFKKASENYRTLFPNTVVGDKAEERFRSQIRSLEEFDQLEASMKNYRAYLSAEDWRKPKTSFQNFLGTKRSGFFWKSYITFKPTLVKRNMVTGGIADV